MRLKNRIAIVTGAAGGIGEAVAHLFAQHGAGVMVADLNSVWGCRKHQNPLRIKVVWLIQ